MLNNRIGIICPLLGLALLMLSNGPLLAQEKGDPLGTEVVNIVKPYTPTISDAFKVKETPQLSDSITTTKKQVDYSIFSVPVASTFTPAKGTAEGVEKAPPMKLYDSYVTLGFGNYTTILGELFTNFDISRTDQAGIYLKHNSSQGGIDGLLLENKFYDTQLDANYTSRQQGLSYTLLAGGGHQLFNWYGLNDLFTAETLQDFGVTDPEQVYYDIYLGGDIGLTESVFEGGSVFLRYTGDAFSSNEAHLTVSPEFLLPLSELNIKFQGELDFVNGSFERNYFDNGQSIEYGSFIAGFTPSLVYVNEDLTVSLGASAVLGVNTKDSNTELFIFPQLNASYRLVEEIVMVYGGVEGGLSQNTYHNFKVENPFVSPTLTIVPTEQVYNVFVGLKGKLSKNVSYNTRGSYGKENNKPLYQLNPYQGRLPELQGYELGNSFGVVYDDIQTLDLFGELKVEVSQKFNLGLNANVYSYNTQDQAQPWNLPNIKASAFSNFNITEKIFGGATLFFVGERQALFTATQVGLPTLPVTEERSLDAYADVNLHLGYRLNDRLSFFAKGSNLLNNNYEKWLFTPVQGLQGLLGATYKFDWE